jgi:hypothetical protein
MITLANALPSLPALPRLYPSAPAHALGSRARCHACSGRPVGAGCSVVSAKLNSSPSLCAVRCGCTVGSGLIELSKCGSGGEENGEGAGRSGRRDGHYQMWSATRVSHRCRTNYPSAVGWHIRKTCWIRSSPKGFRLQTDSSPLQRTDETRDGTTRLVPSVGSRVQSRKLLCCKHVLSA